MAGVLDLCLFEQKMKFFVAYVL